MSDDHDRVIPATPRRREEARRRGMMAPAAPAAWMASAGVALGLAPAWASATLPAAAGLMRAAIRGSAGPLPPDLAAGIAAVALPTLAVIAASAVAGVGVRIALEGPSWHPSRAAPDLRRLDPVAGLARILSRQTLATVAAGGASVAVLVAAGWLALPPAATAVDGITAAAAAWRSTCWIAATAAVVAGCRWVAARRRFERRIRMTPEEFAAEVRSVKSDPKVRPLDRRGRQPGGGAA